MAVACGTGHVDLSNFGPLDRALPFVCRSLSFSQFQLF